MRWRSVPQLGERSSKQWYNNLPSIAMPGTLFVVATPIGNLEDVTLRALRVLQTADLIAAEDTRRTAGLLSHHSISTPTLSFHQHNKPRTRLSEHPALAQLCREYTAKLESAGYNECRQVSYGWGKMPNARTAIPFTDISTRASARGEIGAASIGASKYISFTIRR